MLVTGLSGFTGRYLRERLEADGLTVLEPSRAGDAPFDLTRKDTLRRAVEQLQPDYVIHLAAISFVAHDDATAFYAVNTVGTCNLLEALAETAPRVRKVIVASSANVYGITRADPIDEATPPAPVNHYACSKLAMEHMARTWFDRLPIVLTRPFNYTGAGQGRQFVVPKIVSHFAAGKAEIELGNLDVVRDFSDVRMVSDAYRRLLDAPIVSQVVNICSGQGRSLQWIIDQTSRIAGRSIRVRVNPAFLRAADVPRLIGSNARLRATIGEPTHTDFADTLASMYAYEVRAAAGQPAGAPAGRSPSEAPGPAS